LFFYGFFIKIKSKQISKALNNDLKLLLSFFIFVQLHWLMFHLWVFDDMLNYVAWDFVR